MLCEGDGGGKEKRGGHEGFSGDEVVGQQVGFQLEQLGGLICKFSRQLRTNIQWLVGHPPRYLDWHRR